MKVNVRLFAAAKQWAGVDLLELETAGNTVADLRQAVLQQVPNLSAFGSHLRFAINSEFADDETIVPSDAEVACIPPVSGG